MADLHTEPQNVYDLMLMAHTRKPAVCQNAISVRDFAPKPDGVQVGDIAAIYTLVEPHTNGTISVIDEAHIYCEVNERRTGGFIHTERTTVITYKTFDEFRASEWWDKTLEAWGSGCPDASWGDTIQVNGVDVATEGLHGMWPSTDIDYLTLPHTLDWLGNPIYDQKPIAASIRIRPLEDTLELWREGAEIIETSYDEIREALALKERLDKLGITLDDDTITLPLVKVSHNETKD